MALLVQANEISRVRRRFYISMWSLYCSIVGISTLVAVVRFLLGEDGTLHHFISTTSNHLVLVSNDCNMTTVTGACYLE